MNLKRTWDYMKALKLTFLMVALMGLSIWGIVLLAPTVAHAGWIAIPIFTLIGSFIGSIFITAIYSVPEVFLVKMKWSGDSKSTHKAMLKAQKQARREAVKKLWEYRKYGNKEGYYAEVIRKESDIGELTGKGYDMPTRLPKRY